MGVLSEPNVTNVFAGGPVEIYIAAAGTAIPLAAGTPPPFFSTLPVAADWLNAGFSRVGYTENGFELVDTPSVKEVVPDELITPALQIITGIKAEAKFTLLEATAENLKRALALATFNNNALGVKTIGVGSGGTLPSYCIAAQGPSPNGPRDRITVVWKANVISAVTVAQTRKDVQKLACSFAALSDSTKPAAYDVFIIEEEFAGS